MIKADKYYIDNLRMINDHGCYDENPRPKYSDGSPAYSKFVTQVFETYDISKGEFPITTLRNTATKMGINEVLWIYSKQTSDLKTLNDMGVKWWNEFDVGDGTIGHRYGYVVNKYNLMKKLLDGLKNDPFGRRHIIDLYQYEDLISTAGLFPCAYLTMWSVRKVDDVYYLDMNLTQRSNDYIMAGYINKIQYVALLMMVASHLGYKPGVFTHYVQNLHIYSKHMQFVENLLNTTPLDVQPKIELINDRNFYDFTINDFKITGIDNIPKLGKLELAI